MVLTYDLESFSTIEPEDAVALTLIRVGTAVAELRLQRVAETIPPDEGTVQDFSGVIGAQALACLAE